MGCMYISRYLNLEPPQVLRCGQVRGATALRAPSKVTSISFTSPPLFSAGTGFAAADAPWPPCHDRASATAHRRAGTARNPQTPPSMCPIGNLESHVQLSTFHSCACAERVDNGR